LDGRRSNRFCTAIHEAKKPPKKAARHEKPHEWAVPDNPSIISGAAGMVQKIA
jgi:hypothetical protein